MTRLANNAVLPFATWTVAVVVLAGCGGPKPYPVHGQVTLDQQPLDGAFISFVGQDEAASVAVASTDSQGKYILGEDAQPPGALPGKYVVRISTYSEGNPDDVPPQPPVPEKIPERYNVRSELVREVKAEANAFNFTLTSEASLAPR